jgi:hypothetical protein
MTEPRVTLLVRVSGNLKARLAEIAKRERRSLSKQVELLLERCLGDFDAERRTTQQPQKGRHRSPKIVGS